MTTVITGNRVRCVTEFDVSFDWQQAGAAVLASSQQQTCWFILSTSLGWASFASAIADRQTCFTRATKKTSMSVVTCTIALFSWFCSTKNQCNDVIVLSSALDDGQFWVNGLSCVYVVKVLPSCLSDLSSLSTVVAAMWVTLSTCLSILCMCVCDIGTERRLMSYIHWSISMLACIIITIMEYDNGRSDIRYWIWVCVYNLWNRQFMLSWLVVCL